MPIRRLEIILLHVKIRTATFDMADAQTCFGISDPGILSCNKATNGCVFPSITDANRACYSMVMTVSEHRIRTAGLPGFSPGTR
jgi:hypothetical protein